MPPFLVKVEVTPNLGEDDPASVNKLRELKASGISGSKEVTSLLLSQLIDFKLESDSIESAKEQAQKMCDQFLVNHVLASAEVTVTPIDS